MNRDSDTAAGRTGSVDLDVRYGRTPVKRRRDRWIFGVAAVLFAFVLGLWVAWAGLTDITSSVDTSDTGFQVIDEHSVSIRFQLSMPAGSTASCALQAQNQAHGIVGWKVVEIGASDRFTRSFTDIVRTSERSVTGLIYRCWLT